ncbi:MAG: hypothetical protein ACI9N9_000013 [Enterobacterales bacterium]|jgi:hypothetical protein
MKRKELEQKISEAIIDSDTRYWDESEGEISPEMTDSDSKFRSSLHAKLVSDICDLLLK